MRDGIFPKFAKGRVLKKESIEYLRDFPQDIANLAFNDYSDGILYGFTISFEEESILISKGAIKYQGDIIIVPKSNIPIIEYGQLLYIKMIIGQYSETEDYKICPIETKIDNREPLNENEIELGRFCLNPGAILRCRYDSFSDLFTSENTLGITHVLYAGAERTTLHPLVLKEYARTLMMSSSEATDVAFALMCLNASVIHKSSIQWYIAKKRNTTYEEYPLPELCRKLEEMLPQHDCKNKPKKPKNRRPNIS